MGSGKDARHSDIKWQACKHIMDRCAPTRQGVGSAEARPGRPGLARLGLAQRTRSMVLEVEDDNHASYVSPRAAPSIDPVASALR